MTFAEIVAIADTIANAMLTVGGPLAAVMLARWARASLDEKQRQDLRVIAGGVYWATERYGRVSGLKSHDKLARALRLLDEELGRPATESEKRLAAGVWRAKAEKNKPRTVGEGDK